MYLFGTIFRGGRVHIYFNKYQWQQNGTVHVALPQNYSVHVHSNEP